MSTPAIANPANILSAPMPASGNSPAAAAAPEVPFNQVLQKEITGRKDNEPAAKAAPKNEKEKEPTPAAQTAAGQASSSSESKKTESSDKVGKEESDTADEDSKDLDSAAAASAELLALVANIAQISTPAAQSEAADASQAADGKGLNFGIDADGGKKGKSGIGQLSAKSEIEAASQQKAGTDKNTNFADLAKRINQGNAEPHAQLSAARSTTEKDGIGIQAMKPVLDQTAAMQEQAALPAASALTPIQQALNKIHPSAAADKLTPPVGTPAWDQAVGQKVVWMVAGNQQSASLTLNPPDLGPLQIVLNVNNSQANATFVAAQPEVRQALEAALPKLREMLGDAGIQLGQASINAGNPQQGNSFSGQQQQRQSSGQPSQDDRTIQPIHTIRQQAIKGGNGMVDTFA